MRHMDMLLAKFCPLRKSTNLRKFVSPSASTCHGAITWTPSRGESTHATPRPKIATVADIARNCYGELQTYSAPDFCRDDVFVPKYRIPLAQLPTPIHRWDLKGVPDTVSIHIKRDDMTGSSLSGNKIRKLEFFLADAVASGCKNVITCGDIQSNHCRSTAVAARQLGLQCHLVIRTPSQTGRDIDWTCNVLLTALCDVHIHTVPTHHRFYTHLVDDMRTVAHRIKATRGEDSYIIPIGGDPLTAWGYVHAFQEMLLQGVCDDFDDIVFAIGAGGTAEGLVIARHMAQAGVRLHGVTVSDCAAYHHHTINRVLRDFGIHDTTSEQSLDIIDGYNGRGYGQSTRSDFELVRDVSQHTGIFLDPVYTGKAVFGLTRELHRSPNRFQGSRILFIHTGGLFSLFDNRINSVLDKTSVNPL